MFNARRMLAVPAVIAMVLLTAAGCPPEAGDSCDPSKDFSYFSSHTDNGKTTTVRLECQPVVDTTGRGLPDRYEWVKV